MESLTPEEQFDLRYGDGDLMLFPGEIIALTPERRDHLSSLYSSEIESVYTKGIDTCLGVGFRSEDGTWVIGHLNDNMWKNQDEITANLMETFGSINRFSYDEGAAVTGAPVQDPENADYIMKYADTWYKSREGRYGGARVSNEGVESFQTEFFDKDCWGKPEIIEFRSSIGSNDAEDVYTKLTQ